MSFLGRAGGGKGYSEPAKSPSIDSGSFDWRGPAAILPGLPSPRVILWFAVAALSSFYVAFNRKLLPHRYAKVAARLFFWPTIPFTIVSRWDNYWTVVDDTVILGAAPIALLGHVEALRDMGVTGVVNLCDEYNGPVDLYDKYGMEQLWLPVVDHFEPPVRDLRRAVAFIRERQKRGEKAFVHCRAGHGRSAAVALCWMLAQNPGVPLKALNTRLRDKRSVRKLMYQQADIKAFAKDLALVRDSGKGA